MTTLISKAGSEYLLQSGLDVLHRETLEWLSELEFVKIELSFLLKLTDKAFLKARGAQKLSELNSIENRLKVTRNKTLKELYESLTMHEEHLSALDNVKTGKTNEQSVREEHSIHSAAIRKFIESVRSLKKELFDAFEKQIRLTKKILSDFENGRVVM
jgi:hypothetical protein